MTRFVSFLTFALGVPLLAVAQTAEPALVLPKVVTYSEQVANQTPVGTFAMPVSGLRFEPRVDVQARNLAEGQADVAIRGGVFENTGFKLGALALHDPQTGHYFAEIPVAPAMLQLPRVLTGTDNAVGGFNAGVGTVAYGWRPIETRGELAVAFGDYNSNRQSFYQGLVGSGLATDIELARSESDGSVPFGDHDFKRLSSRVQLQGIQSQTDFFVGVQQKFFGWPNLYTPFGFNETEYLRTSLYAINHRAQLNATDYWQIGGYYRRNYDDYEFNRPVPGASNPFQHTTEVQAVSLEGRLTEGDYLVDYSLQAMRDELESTALTFGRFRERDYYKATFVGSRDYAVASGALKLRAGLSFDDTNRDESALSPILEAALTRPDGTRLYAQYSEATQVPTYTALNSNTAAGLFRGNPNLGRGTSRNLEAGVALQRAGWKLEAAVFHRWDDDLTDWTFTRGITARFANAVDIATTGLEIVATRRTARYDVVLGYTLLDKDADYGIATVDASFYALNFAKHRLTAALTARLGQGFEVRVDNEFRIQEENLLRTIGGEKAVLTSVGLYYLPPRLRGLELSALVDNLWDDDFQEVPAVPAARRQFSVGATYRW